MKTLSSGIQNRHALSAWRNGIFSQCAIAIVGRTEKLPQLVVVERYALFVGRQGFAAQRLHVARVVLRDQLLVDREVEQLLERAEVLALSDV